MLLHSKILLYLTPLGAALSIFLLMKPSLIIISLPLSFFPTSALDISILLDWPAMMFLTTVMFISSMILMFSHNYIPSKEHNMFSLVLLMFVASMSLLILSNNLILMIVGWDGLGLSSFILVIYYQNPSSSASGLITILSNRLGDIAILLTLAILFSFSNWNLNMNTNFPMILSLLILLAAITKSAQFPFSAWLPAAMAAPTPISALVHSSTLVTAGVFLMFRVSSHLHPQQMFLLMIISSFTTLYSSMNANWEQDLKKIIALSTLSQIAIMMFAISINQTNLALFHLITHALFKSTMFLCAGTMIHNSSYQDMRFMASTQLNSPPIMTTLGLSNMALMGVPFMSGFFSKDKIMETMITSPPSLMLSMLMISSIGLTATYSIRMISKSSSTELKTPDLMNHNNKAMEKAILIMSPLSILTGTSITWLIIPTQTLIMPAHMKMLILSFLSLGIIIGALLNFKSKIFLKLGLHSSSMWFLHNLTSLMMHHTQPPMKSSLSNDNSWKEIYGPQGAYLTLTNSALNTELITLTLMSITLIFLITPLILML